MAEKQEVSTAKGCLISIIMVVVLGVLGVIIFGGRSPVTKPSTTYKATVAGFLPIDSQEGTVYFKVVNTGKHAGKPDCTISAMSPGGADSGTDEVTAVKALAPGAVGLYKDTFTIANNGADNVRKSGVTVSCS